MINRLKIARVASCILFKSGLFEITSSPNSTPVTIFATASLIAITLKPVKSRLLCNNSADLDEKIQEMIDYDGPVIFDCQVDPNENCFPMIPSGKPHNQMILGPNDQEENKIKGKGKALF